MNSFSFCFLYQIYLLIIKYNDYEVVSRGFGGAGLKLDKSHDDKIEQVLEEARAEYKKGKSVLINALIGKTSFREGSISV
jgi:acetolactate synthase-like protein